MRIVASFSNAAEAGFVQTLLADAGIESSFQGDNFEAARLLVDDADFQRAVEIVAAHRVSRGERGVAQSDIDQRSNAHFPFLGIMGLTAILWCAFWTLTVLRLAPRGALMKEGFFRGVMWITVTVSTSLFWGMIIGAVVALVCLIAMTTWRKLTQR